MLLILKKNIMKKTKIIYSFTLLTILLFCSCENETSDEEFKAKSFDLTTFESAKSKISTLKPLDFKKIKNIYEGINSFSKENEDIKQIIVNEVNQSFDQPILQIEALNYIEYDGEEILNKGLENGIFNELDVEIVNDLADDLVNLGKDLAIQNLEIKVLSSEFNETEYLKYNHLANQLLLNLEMLDYSSQSESTDLSVFSGWRCAMAITAFTLSTIAVGAACVPNPTTPIACPLAITQSTLSYATMIAACKKDSTQIDDI